MKVKNDKRMVSGRNRRSVCVCEIKGSSEEHNERNREDLCRERRRSGQRREEEEKQGTIKKV